MLRRCLSNYLRTYRQKWGLSQRELGELLGVSRHAVGKYELEQRPVSAELIVATELIFGEPFPNIFPFFSASVEDAVGSRALLLHSKLEGRADAKSQKKLTLLAGIPARLKFVADI